MSLPWMSTARVGRGTIAHVMLFKECRRRWTASAGSSVGDSGAESSFFWVASPPDATMRAEIRRETTLRQRPESPLARFHGEGPVVSAAGFAADKVLRIGE